MVLLVMAAGIDAGVCKNPDHLPILVSELSEQGGPKLNVEHIDLNPLRR
jgi:hypothetical protein